MGRAKKALVDPKQLILKIKDEIKETQKRFDSMESDRFILIGRLQELQNFLLLLEAAAAAPPIKIIIPPDKKTTEHHPV